MTDLGNERTADSHSLVWWAVVIMLSIGFMLVLWFGLRALAFERDQLRAMQLEAINVHRKMIELAEPPPGLRTVLRGAKGVVSLSGLVIEDAQGRVRARIGELDDNRFGIGFYDDNGKRVCCLADGGQGGVLELCSKQGSRELLLSTDETASGIRLHEGKGTSRKGFLVASSFERGIGKCELQINGPIGSIGMRVGQASDSKIAIYDQNGQILKTVQAELK